VFAFPNLNPISACSQYPTAMPESLSSIVPRKERDDTSKSPVMKAAPPPDRIKPSATLFEALAMPNAQQ